MFLFDNVTLFETIPKSGTVYFGFFSPRSHMYGINLPMSLTCEVCLKSRGASLLVWDGVNPSNWWYWIKWCKYKENTLSLERSHPMICTDQGIPLAEVYVGFICSRSSEHYSLCSLCHKHLKKTLMYILGNGIRRTWKLMAAFLAFFPASVGESLYLCGNSSLTPFFPDDPSK